ncbi:Lon protease [Corynebacterium cystitidis DSM 20524]|uniref:endopeptidase La n=2 Tax=Corynebacterium cystitidis TaxID=35757 RepID=A0A1H9QFJ3_9CORY|nr:Lon protease [Corynebacterium cystitidis DSM 20524]SER59170.1 PDZ domain-containing protein [Corynebacterium cystitidis DSM 20524]SNV83383.1 putative secreted protein [Corynebacterium cystitidis]
MNQPRSTTNRRLTTIFVGAIPVMLLAGVVTLDHIPGTDFSLAVPYAAQGPGPTFNTLGDVDGQPVVEIRGAETDETSGNLNMTTVSVRTNMTLAQVLGRWLFTDDTIVPIEQILPPDKSEEEIQQRNEQAFVSSEAAATVAAMNYLGKPTIVVVHDTMGGTAADGVVEPGDTIVAVDGTDVSQPGVVQEIVRSKAPGDTVELTLRRGDEELTETITLGEHPDEAGVALLGITMTSAPEESISVEYNLNDIGGPSAGMIFSLAVIDKLSPGQLNGGKFVAGTGTISEDGTVGAVGGIQHKVAAADDEGAELFLAPADNCAEALRADTDDLVIAKVDTLDDAIAAMDAFAAGEDVLTCTK